MCIKVIIPIYNAKITFWVGLWWKYSSYKHMYIIWELFLLTLSNRTSSISNSWIFSSFNCVCSICSSSLDSKFYEKNNTSLRRFFLSWTRFNVSKILSVWIISFFPIILGFTVKICFYVSFLKKMEHIIFEYSFQYQYFFNIFF